MTITTAQLALLSPETTKPLVLIQWAHSGLLELLSCGDDAALNGEKYTEGLIKLESMEANKRAVLSVPATATRLAEMQTRSWRNGACKIYSVFSAPDVSDYITKDVLLSIDGVIVKSSSSDLKTVKVIVEHRGLSSLMTPRNIIDEVTKNTNPAGATLTWQGTKIIFKAPR